MTELISTAVALGAVYALLGAAVSVTAIATRTLHLAVGEILVAGVLLQVVAGVEAVTSVPLWAAALAAVALGALLGALLEPFVLRWLPLGTPSLVGLAVAAGVLDAATVRTVGARTYRPTPLFELPSVGAVGGATIAAIAIGLAFAVVLALALARTRWGRRIRIAGSVPDAALHLGIDPRRTRLSALAATGAAAVVAGLLVTPITFVAAGQGTSFTVRGLAAAVLLGRAGPARAILAGLGLGFVDALALSAWPDLGSEVVVGAVIVTVLLVRGPDELRRWGRAW